MTPTQHLAEAKRMRNKYIWHMEASKLDDLLDISSRCLPKLAFPHG